MGPSDKFHWKQQSVWPCGVAKSSSTQKYRCEYHTAHIIETTIGLSNGSSIRGLFQIEPRIAQNQNIRSPISPLQHASPKEEIPHSLPATSRVNISFGVSSPQKRGVKWLSSGLEIRRKSVWGQFPRDHSVYLFVLSEFGGFWPDIDGVINISDPFDHKTEALLDQFKASIHVVTSSDIPTQPNLRKPS